MIIGTAGHVDHGKTALVRALTGVDTDRLKEEKARGISIDLGFAYWPMANRSVVGFVDVPGHERFIHNMLAGATGIDFVMLVVAADDGVMPQTREHLAIVDLLGIAQGIVVLTKSDLVDSARLAEARKEIAEALDGTCLADAEIVAVSAVTGMGLDDLRRQLSETAELFGRRLPRGRFRLAVDRSFSLKGIGTVVTGSVLSGRIVTGDRVIVGPSGLGARVRTIHAQNQPTGSGQAGDRCALNLVGDGVSKDAISRGDVVLDPLIHAPTDRIDAKLRILRSEPKPLAQWTPIRLHHAASEVGAHIVLLSEQGPAAGAEAFVQLVLDRPIAAAAGDRFIVRDTSGQRTIGGGAFVDLRAPARKRRSPERLRQLQAYAIADPETALSSLLEPPNLYVDLIAFARDRALTEAECETMASRLEVVRFADAHTTYAVAVTTWAAFATAIGEELRAFHSAHSDQPGMDLGALRMQVQPRMPAKVFAVAIQELARGGQLALDGARTRLAGHAARLAPHDEALWQGIAPLVGGTERFRPPRVRDLATLLSAGEADVRRVMKQMARLGRVHEIAKDHFFLHETIAEVSKIVDELSRAEPSGEFTLAQLRDRLDNGRKVAVQILEFFDRHGITLRRGDSRRINPHPKEAFRALALPRSDADAAH